MRLDAIVTAAILPAVFFGVAGKQSVHANVQQYQRPITVVMASQRMPSSPAKPKVVTVHPGDYLAKIAKDNKTTYPRLFSANPAIKDPDLIYPGQKIKIPAVSDKLTDRNSVDTEQTTSPSQYEQPRSTSVAPVKVSVVHYASPSSGGVWDRIAQCESGGNWSINTGNGFYGGLQFTLSSWRGVGGSGYPNQASRAEQIARAKLLQARQGWGAWPACTAKLGIR